MGKSYVLLIKECYFDSRARIRANVGTTNFIEIERLMKQGDQLSCFLFCMVLVMVVLRTDEKNPNSGYLI